MFWHLYDLLGVLDVLTPLWLVRSVRCSDTFAMGNICWSGYNYPEGKKPNSPHPTYPPLPSCPLSIFNGLEIFTVLDVLTPLWMEPSNVEIIWCNPTYDQFADNAQLMKQFPCRTRGQSVALSSDWTWDPNCDTFTDECQVHKQFSCRTRGQSVALSSDWTWDPNCVIHSLMNVRFRNSSHAGLEDKV